MIPRGALELWIKKSNYAGHEYWIRYRTDLQRRTLLYIGPSIVFKFTNIFFYFFSDIYIRIYNNPCRTEPPQVYGIRVHTR